MAEAIYTTGLTLRQLLALEAVLSAARVGDVALLHIQAAHSGLQTVRTTIAEIGNIIDTDVGSRPY